VVGGVSGSDGIIAEGSVFLQAMSPVTVSEQIQAEDIYIIATDDDNDGPGEKDDLIVENGVTLHSTAGDIILCAGDDLIIEDGGTLIAAGAIQLNGDCGNADSSGSSMDLQGVIDATALTISGGADDDVIALTHLTTEMPTTIDLGAGNDNLNLGSYAALLTNIDGVIDGFQSQLTVLGGDGVDSMSVDDSGDVEDNIGTLTDSTITGLGMDKGINYGGVEIIDVFLGGGNDTFNVQSTLEGTTTTIHSNNGNDTFNISSAAPANQGTLP
jgi:hypothetical protein